MLTFPTALLHVLKISSPDPIAEVQFDRQVHILTVLTQLLKQKPSDYTLGVEIDSVVHVGHSFGSYLTLAVAASNPVGFSDGIILTGYTGQYWADTFIAGCQIRVAALTDPKWAALPPGYVVPVDIYSLAFLGVKSPYFDHDVMQYLYDVQNPFTVGELVTAGASPSDSSLVQVPVQVSSFFHSDVIYLGSCALLQDSADMYLM